MVVCDEAIKKLGLACESTRVIIQGFGNVGSNAARLMAEAGYKVIGIAEVDGGLYRKDGIDVEALWEYHQRNGTVHGFPEADAVAAADLLVTDCEILIPAATVNQITSCNADRVKCRILAEGANGPTTAAADESLAEKRVFVVADILCNAGGVTTSLLLHGSANMIGGQAIVIKHKYGASRDAMLFPGAPRSIKFASGENPKRVYGGRDQLPSTRMGNFAVQREALVQAQEYKRDWDEYDAKVKRGEKDPKRPKRDLKLEALADVLRGSGRTPGLGAGRLLRSGVVAAEVDSRVHDAIHRFEHDEDAFAEFLTTQGQTREEFDTEAREESEKSVRTRLVLDALADAEEISVNDQELTERIVFQAREYQMPPEEFVRRIQEAGQLGAIYADVRRSKALIAAVRAATVTDASGNPLDLSDLLGEDDDQDDAAGIEVLEVPAPEDADESPVVVEGETVEAVESKSATS